MSDGGQAALDYDAFRKEVRDFAITQCPSDLRQAVVDLKKLGRSEMCAWQKILYARGWGAPNWPKEHGGTGWDLRQRLIFEEVMSECDCPTQPYQGLRHFAPVLIEFGTPEQQARYLPSILSGEAFWCQGYSEPGAGSDLASLKTRAERDGEDYLVNGQKIWTTGAHEADMMYALVRTSKGARKQDGISMLLIPMDSAGLTVRPIHLIDGAHKVNEVFFDNVRVPVDNRVGAEGKGWSYGKFLLNHERLGGANVAPVLRQLGQTRRMVAEELHAAIDRVRKDDLQRRLLKIEAEVLGIRGLGQRAVEDIINKRPLDTTSSVIKLLSSQVMQALDEIGLDAKGREFAARFRTLDANSDDSEEPGVKWLRNFLFGRARTIYGGSQEVQKNVLARTLFEGSLSPFNAMPLSPGDLRDTAMKLSARADAALAPITDPKARKEMLAGLWQEMTDLAWQSVAIPEAMGGAGGDLRDVAALAEGLARSALPLPVSSICGVVPILLNAAGGSGAKLLAGIADGRYRVGAAIESLHAEGGVAVHATIEAGGLVRLSGKLIGVECPPDTTHYIISCKVNNSVGLIVVPADDSAVNVRAHERIDRRRTVDLTLNGSVSAEQLLMRGDAAAEAEKRAVEVGALLVCVEAVAAMGALLERTIEYLANRIQFDAPLSSFQVLRHRVAELFASYENARAMVLGLLENLSSGDWPAREIALAKLHLGGEARRFAASTIQMHGGMGMSEELLASRLAKRLLIVEFEYGDSTRYEGELLAADRQTA